MNKIIIAVLITALPMAAQAKDTVGAAFEIESANSLIRKIDNVASHFGATNQSKVIRSAISQLTNSEDMKGIDPERKISGYILLPENASDLSVIKGSEPPFVLALPVTGDGSAYLNALTESLGKPKIQNKIYRFSKQTSQSPQQKFFVKLVRTYAVVSATESNTAFVASTDSPTRLRPDLLRDTPGALRIGVNVQAFMPLMKSAAETAASEMKTAPSGTGPAGQPMNTSELAQAQMNFFLTFLKDIKTARVALDTTGEDTVDIRGGIEALPETKIAEVLASISPPSKAYRALVPNNSPLIVVAGGMNALDYFIDPYLNLVDKMYASIGYADEEAITKMKKGIKGIKGLYAGNFTAGLVPAAGNQFAMAQIAETKNEQQALDYIEKNVVSYNETYAGISPGVSIKPLASRTNNGVRIQRFRYSFDLPQTQQMQQPALPSWLKNIQLEFAVVNDDLIQTMGSPAVMDEMLERLNNAQTAGQPINKNQLFGRLFPQIDDKSVKLYVFKPLSTVKLILGSLPNSNPQMLNMIPDSPGGIAGHVVKEGNRVESVTRITLDEILAIKNSAGTIGSLFFQAMISGMATSQPKAPPEVQATNECVNNLKLLHAAKEQAALEKNLKKGEIVPLNWLREYLPGSRLPVCPNGGAYSVNPVGTPPECSIKGHKLTY